jgi:hypothetical protein
MSAPRLVLLPSRVPSDGPPPRPCSSAASGPPLPLADAVHACRARHRRGRSPPSGAAVGEQGGAQRPSPARQATVEASPRSPRAPAAASGSSQSRPRAQHRWRPWPTRPSSLSLLPRRRGSIASLLHPAAACMAGAAETASMVGSRGHVDGALHCLRICPPWLADPWRQWRVPARRHGGGSGRIRAMAAARGAGGGRSPPLPPHLPHAMAGLLEVHRATSAGPDLLDLSRARLSFFPAHPLVPLPPPDAGVGGRGGLRRPPPRAMVDRDGLRSVPWRAASSSAGRIRTRSPWQSSWRRPVAVVPRTCSTPHPRTPASRAASAAGIHGQERFELSYLGRGGSKWWTGSRVSSSAARLDVSPSRTVSRSLSESKSLRVSAPRSVCAGFGAAAWRRGGRRAAAAGTADSSALGNLGAAASNLLCPPIQPPPLHFVGSSNLHAVAEESILLHQTPSEVTNLSIAATSRSARMLWTQIISL